MVNCYNCFRNTMGHLDSVNLLDGVRSGGTLANWVVVPRAGSWLGRGWVALVIGLGLM